MKKHCLLLLLLTAAAVGFSQDNKSESSISSLAKGTEFSIPVSPAFDLLAVNPSQVTRPTNIREFKVDWSFRSWRLKPNIAIQAQPIWEIFYNRADLSNYRKASPILKMISTLDLSAGTIEDDDQIRRVALAAKLNVYRQHDPLADVKIYENIDTSYRREQAERSRRINELYYKKDQKRLEPELRKEMAIEWDSLQTVSAEAARAQKEKIQEVASDYMKNHWNASHVDVAFGKMLSYDGTGGQKLTYKSEAASAWINACLGIGKKVMLTALARYVQPIGQDLGGTLRVADLFSSGLGFRYGSTRFNFFAEYILNSASISDVLANQNNELNISQVAPRSITYGGDWRISRNVLLNYGVRTDYTSDFKFQNLIPTAGVSCMMR